MGSFRSLVGSTVLTDFQPHNRDIDNHFDRFYQNVARNSVIATAPALECFELPRLHACLQLSTQPTYLEIDNTVGFEAPHIQIDVDKFLAILEVSSAWNSATLYPLDFVKRAVGYLRGKNNGQLCNSSSIAFPDGRKDVTKSAEQLRCSDNRSVGPKGGGGNIRLLALLQGVSAYLPC